MKSIAIIPAFNEESTIENVIKNTHRFVDEVLVINDGSTDKTVEKSKKAGATVIDNIVNRGLGRPSNADTPKPSNAALIPRYLKISYRLSL